MLTRLLQNDFDTDPESSEIRSIDGNATEEAVVVAVDPLLRDPLLGDLLIGDLSIGICYSLLLLIF